VGPGVPVDRFPFSVMRQTSAKAVGDTHCVTTYSEKSVDGIDLN
jgi:hypothetical protein